jgi:hypothetical protein
MADIVEAFCGGKTTPSVTLTTERRMIGYGTKATWSLTEPLSRNVPGGTEKTQGKPYVGLPAEIHSEHYLYANITATTACLVSVHVVI